jgi:hypothetical protein
MKNLFHAKTKSRAALITIALLVTACGGPSRTISETTTAFPKCDMAKGKISLEDLRCNRGQLCSDSSGGFNGGLPGGSPAAYFARAKGVEGNTLAGLQGAHRKLTGMLENALRETGCFESVERYTPEKGQGEDWRVGGDVRKIFAWADEAMPRGVTSRHRDKQTASADITVDIKQGGSLEVINQKKLHVSAERVGALKYNTFQFDWSRKRDEEGFGETAMQDVATEIVTEAAVFITEKLAGARITHRVAPPTRKSEGMTGQEGNTPDTTPGK